MFIFCTLSAVGSVAMGVFCPDQLLPIRPTQLPSPQSQQLELPAFVLEVLLIPLIFSSDASCSFYSGARARCSGCRTFQLILLMTDPFRPHYQNLEIPLDAEGFTQSFKCHQVRDCPRKTYLFTLKREEFLNFFETYGFVVVDEVLNGSEVTNTIDELWHEVESFDWSHYNEDLVGNKVEWLTLPEFSLTVCR